MTSTSATPIEVTVLGGYLGAGKTTMLNHILRTADERLAVLVNDFGDINIDADLIESDDGVTISLSNGCICCSLVDGFVGALNHLQSLDQRPERVVIEASGVANPAQIAAFAYRPGFVLSGTVVVVDAERISRQLRDEYIADVIRQQILAADLLVLNKVDLVPDVDGPGDEVGAIATVPIIPATAGVVPLDVLLGADAAAAPQRSADLGTAQFLTWTEKAAAPVDRAVMERRLGDLPASVVRAKGLVRLSESPNQTTVVQLVGPRLSLTTGGRWQGGPSRLVVIGVNAGKPNVLGPMNILGEGSG